MRVIKLIHAERKSFGKAGTEGQDTGIHRLDPTLSDLQDALKVANRDGFEVIYAHARMPSKGISEFIKELRKAGVRIKGKGRVYILEFEEFCDECNSPKHDDDFAGLKREGNWKNICVDCDHKSNPEEIEE